MPPILRRVDVTKAISQVALTCGHELMRVGLRLGAQLDVMVLVRVAGTKDTMVVTMSEHAGEAAKAMLEDAYARVLETQPTYRDIAVISAGD